MRRIHFGIDSWTLRAKYWSRPNIPDVEDTDHFSGAAVIVPWSGNQYDNSRDLCRSNAVAWPRKSL